MLENPHVRDPTVEYAKAHGWISINVDYSGWPDRLFVTPWGLCIWVEFKKPKGSRHMLRQKHRLRTLRQRGCHAYLVKTKEEGLGLVDLYQANREMEPPPVPGEANDSYAPPSGSRSSPGPRAG